MSTDTITRIMHSLACSMIDYYCTRTNLYPVHYYYHLFLKYHLKMTLEGNYIMNLTLDLLPLYLEICNNSLQSFITYLNRMFQNVSCLLFKASMDMTLGTFILFCIMVSMSYLLHSQLN